MRRHSDIRARSQPATRIAALALAAGCAAAAAAPPVEGTVLSAGKLIRISHVAAVLHDNAEGWHARPLVIVFADRPIPAGALRGRPQSEVARIGAAGQLRGMVVRIDPKRPGDATLTVLEVKGSEQSGVTYTMADGAEPVVTGLRIGASTVEGTMQSKASSSRPGYTLRFDAPLQRDAAPTANLHGQAVTAAEPFKAATACAQVIANGDLAATRACTAGAYRKRIDAEAAKVGAEKGVERLRRRGAALLSSLKMPVRLVERGSEALLVVVDTDSLTLRREGGAWKLVDEE